MKQDTAHRLNIAHDRPPDCLPERLNLHKSSLVGAHEHACAKVKRR